MEGLNICILKKQIYCEFDIFFSINYQPIHCELFIQYIHNLIFFYKKVSNNIYSKYIDIFEEILNDYDNNNNIILLKSFIGKIDNVDVLLELLSFFVGKTNSRKFIYI